VRVTCRVSAALYFLCGCLVDVAAGFMPFAPGSSRPAVAAVGGVAAISGVVIWFLPWERWGKRSSLWLVPLAFALISVHNVFTGGDGFLYGLFFVVAMVWVGLAHPQGTSVAFLPMLALAYLLPLLLAPHTSGVGPWSAFYLVPGCGLVGETVAWVSGQLRRSETAYRRGEAHFRQLFAANPQPMWLYDTETLRFLEVNDAAVEHYGYSRDEFLTMSIADIRRPDDIPALLESVARPRGETDTSGPWTHRLKDGRMIEVEVRSHLLEFQGRPASLVSVNDVTDRLALEDQLRHQAFHDPLTDLANRALFADRVTHALSRRGRFSKVTLLLLDLDGFKTVNDSLGHSAGDQVLVAVAERLRACLRPADTAARLGGDEFAVLVDDATSVTEAKALADRVIATLEVPFVLGDKQVFVHASIGIAMAAGGTADAEELLRNADAAMYAAKASGRARYAVFERSMHTAAVRRLELDAELRAAVASEQFLLHYQPELLLADRRVVGLEALLRWEHPDRGVVSPAEFMSLAEENGLIVPIGNVVLRAACEQLVVWCRHFAVAPFVAVNLSARQLVQPDLLAWVESCLADTGADPSRLVFEVTESAILTDSDAAGRALQNLRSLGARVALDDFGTGYSSLSHLRSFPIDIVKIDRSFVAGLTQSRKAHVRSEDRSVVAGIVGLAHALRIVTVAEGVESEEQAAVLTELGCDMAQGYLFSPPATAEALTGGVLLGALLSRS